MKVIYVCSPFRAPDAETRRANVERALAVCREIALAGDVPVAPHLLFPRFLDDDVPAERAAGLRCGGVLLARCDEVLVVGEPSEGMAAELRDAEAMGTPVRRWRT